MRDHGKNTRWLASASGLSFLILLAACTTPEKKPEPHPDQLVSTRMSFSDLPGWQQGGGHAGALKAFVESCKRFAAMPGSTPLGAPGAIDAGEVKDWRNLCNTAMNTAPKDARAFFEHGFAPFRVGNNDNSEGLFTGYYEIDLAGSRARNAQYRYPIYALPEDVHRAEGKPYFSRAEIDRGALSGKKLELAFVSDPVELFFLHVQGSGRITLPDGKVLRVGYAGSNGHPYHSIGAYLIEQGEFTRDTMTAPALKQWLYAHPDKLDEVLAQNPSYIFFREVKGEGPIGAQGAVLTAEHSLAVDNTHIPFGVPVWLDTTLPVADDRGDATPFRQLMIAQDKGSAITGVVRGDVFFGYGRRAELLAGHMKQPGSYYVLLPLAVAQQTPPVALTTATEATR